MANELENAVKNAAGQISKYVENIIEMKVVTKYSEVVAGQSGAEDRIAAVSIIRLDGDSETTIPMRASASGGLEVDDEVFSIHQRNVATAIEYRARIMASLLDTLKSLGAR